MAGARRPPRRTCYAPAASGGSANAILFPSGSAMSTWRTSRRSRSGRARSRGSEALEQRLEPADRERDRPIRRTTISRRATAARDRRSAVGRDRDRVCLENGHDEQRSVRVGLGQRLFDPLDETTRACGPEVGPICEPLVRRWPDTVQRDDDANDPGRVVDLRSSSAGRSPRRRVRRPVQTLPRPGLVGPQAVASAKHSLGSFSPDVTSSISMPEMSSATPRGALPVTTTSSTVVEVRPRPAARSTQLDLRACRCRPGHPAALDERLRRCNGARLDP